jgi:uncharacterized repeat protein (TIGR04076 family)
MLESYRISIKVISQSGFCGVGHKVGDEWSIEKITPEGICISAFHGMYPSLRTMMFGGILPHTEKDPDTYYFTCPDTENPVVFELKRQRPSLKQ